MFSLEFGSLFFFKILNSALILWRRVCFSFDLWFCTAGSSVGVLFRLYLIGLDGLKACLVGEIEFGEFLVSICCIMFMYDRFEPVYWGFVSL